MEINRPNITASTYAMKKALDMPNILMDLVRNSVSSGQEPLGTNNPSPQPVDISAITGKGRIIDLVA